MNNPETGLFASLTRASHGCDFNAWGSSERDCGPGAGLWGEANWCRVRQSLAGFVRSPCVHLTPEKCRDRAMWPAARSDQALCRATTQTRRPQRRSPWHRVQQWS
jgi:hypothetical protein